MLSSAASWLHVNVLGRIVTLILGLLSVGSSFLGLQPGDLWHEVKITTVDPLGLPFPYCKATSPFPEPVQERAFLPSAEGTRSYPNPDRLTGEQTITLSCQIPLTKEVRQFTRTIVIDDDGTADVTLTIDPWAK